ncbi:MAG: alcohol dehydrogenase catalytic domain-containing protein, partial [Myxococcota bacterium]
MTASQTMRVARVRGPQKWEVAEVPQPDPGPGEVRVRIEACGICGSDLHFFRDGLMPPGHTPGHEMSGLVDALGDAVEGFHEG